jgi:hypothetical protein
MLLVEVPVFYIYEDVCDLCSDGGLSLKEVFPRGFMHHERQICTFGAVKSGGVCSLGLSVAAHEGVLKYFWVFVALAWMGLAQLPGTIMVSGWDFVVKANFQIQHSPRHFRSHFNIHHAHPKTAPCT